jgi:hypothetical protein
LAVTLNKRLTIGKAADGRQLAQMSPDDAVAAYTGAKGQRVVLDWLPIHHWTKADVWLACGNSADDLARRQMLWKAGRGEEALNGWMAHPAYVMGNQRLSCALCIFVCAGDLENGARDRPEVLKTYIDIEMESGFTFKQGQSLRSLEATRELYPDLYQEPVRSNPRHVPGQLSFDDLVEDAA